jgi:hypothetical protein
MKRRSLSAAVGVSAAMRLSSLMLTSGQTAPAGPPMTFEDPDETLMLPARIESMTVVRHSGVPRLRTTQTYENYRRFVTDSPIVR